MKGVAASGRLRIAALIGDGGSETYDFCGLLEQPFIPDCLYLETALGTQLLCRKGVTTCEETRQEPATPRCERTAFCDSEHFAVPDWEPDIMGQR